MSCSKWHAAKAFAECFLINPLGLLAFVFKQCGWGGGHKGEQVDVIWHISHCDKPGSRVCVCAHVCTRVCIIYIHMGECQQE